MRLLVRDRGKVRRVFDPLGIGFPEQDVVVGDIAAAQLTVTPERRKSVDFSTPFATGVRARAFTGAEAGAYNFV